MAYGVEIGTKWELIGGPREAQFWPRYNAVENPDFVGWVGAAGSQVPAQWASYDNSGGTDGATWDRLPNAGPFGHDALRVVSNTNTSTKGIRAPMPNYTPVAGEHWIVSFWWRGPAASTPQSAYNLLRVGYNLSQPQPRRDQWTFHAFRNVMKGTGVGDNHHITRASGFDGTTDLANVTIAKLPHGPIPGAVEVRRNYVLAPSSEDSVIGLATGNVGSINYAATAAGGRTRNTTAPTGNNAAHVRTITAAGADFQGTEWRTTFLEPGWYAGRVKVKRAGSETWEYQFNPLVDSGAGSSALGTLTGGTGVGSWTEYAIAPFQVVLAAEYTFMFRRPSGLAGAATADVDEVFLTKVDHAGSAVPSYHDGDNLNARWLGTPHNSVSALYDREVNAADVGHYSGNFAGYVWTGTPNDSASVQDGTRAVLNDDSDPDFVGYASEVTGLDSAEVRESFTENIESDGALHGEFFAGRRPVTITAVIGGNVEPAVRNARLARWQAAARAWRRRGPGSREAVLRWQPQGAAESMWIRLRQQQPTRASGMQMKEVPIAMVADNPRIFGDYLRFYEHTPAGSGTAGRSYDRSYNVNYNWAAQRGTFVVNNPGDFDAPVLIYLLNGMATVALQNLTTEEEISINGSIANGQTMTIDTSRKTVYHSDGSNLFDRVELPRTFWWGLAPGDNTLSFLADTFDATARVQVYWRATWM